MESVFVKSQANSFYQKKKKKHEEEICTALPSDVWLRSREAFVHKKHTVQYVPSCASQRFIYEPLWIKVTFWKNDHKKRKHETKAKIKIKARYFQLDVKIIILFYQFHFIFILAIFFASKKCSFFILTFFYSQRAHLHLRIKTGEERCMRSSPCTDKL